MANQIVPLNHDAIVKALAKLTIEEQRLLGLSRNIPLPVTIPTQKKPIVLGKMWAKLYPQLYGSIKTALQCRYIVTVTIERKDPNFITFTLNK